MTTTKEHLAEIARLADVIRGASVLIDSEVELAEESLDSPPPLVRGLYVFRNTEDESGSPLIYGRRTLTPALYEEIAQPAGVQLAIMPYAWELGVRENDGTLSNDKLSAWVAANIPTDFSGLVCPDIESEIKLALHADSTYIGHDLAVTTYNAVYDAIKARAPGAQVGFYGVPSTHPWIRSRSLDEAVTDSFDALAMLRCDWWCPNLYDTALAGIDSEPFQQVAIDWKRSMLRVARMLKSEHGGKLVPLVYERIDSGRSGGNRHLIPDWEILRDQVLVSFDEGADAIGWWGKAERVIEQGSWGTFSDCVGMSRERATTYLLDESPRRLLEDVFLPVCRTYVEP